MPAELSAADGVYVAPSAVASGANVPVPVDDQSPPVAPPLTVPPKADVLWPAQIVWLAPALATAAAWMVIVIAELTGPQGAT